jgi:hypothetical protein
MKKKKKKRVLTRRLPKETYMFLRSHGGAHSSKKGKKGYNRKKEKEVQQRQASDKDLAFYFL